MIICRRATPDELDTIMDLEVRTFTGEQEIPREMNYLPDSSTPQWFCALEDGEIIGAVAFFREDGAWHAGRFAMEPAYRGRHIGTQLITWAFGEMFSSGVEEIIMDGRPATVHILLKLGAEVTGETYPFYASTCTPLRLKKAAFSAAASGSPAFP